MTREEAISLIKSAQLMLINPTTNEPVSDLYEALEMAIKALENHDTFMKYAYEQGKQDALSQEPKAGHWKRISMDKYTTHAQYWYECDKCGEHNLGNTDYCPSCGCRMVEPQESEEISEHNMKMWKEIFKAESEDKE